MAPRPQNPTTEVPSGRNDRDVVAGEASVRAYLLLLEDPSRLVDPDEIARLEAGLANATDPVERLRIAAALERASSPDQSGVVEAFVRDARAWAEAEHIPAAAFLRIGVSEAVLVRAGIVKGRPSRQAAKTTRPRPSVAVVGARVSVEDVKNWAMDQPAEFTIKDANQALGGSLVTANKALQQLLGDGSLVDIGPSPDHKGPGRAPARFAVAKRRKARA